MIIGWTHPFGSGRLFMKEQALPKKLIVVDLDSNSPCIYYENEIFESGIPKGLLYKNSFYAGYAVSLMLYCNMDLFQLKRQK